MPDDLNGWGRRGQRSSQGWWAAGTQLLSVALLSTLFVLCVGPLIGPARWGEACAQSVQGRVKAKPAKLAVDPTKFREGYRETTNVSSSVLAGLALGAANGATPIHQVVIGAAGLRDAGSFCLHVLSRDGQFWSENPFLAPPDSDFWSVQDISVNYRREISEKYQFKDVFIAAGLVPSAGGSGGSPATADGEKACELKNVVYAPTIAFEADRAGPLRAYVNSEGRYTEAELWHSGKLAYAGTCRRPDGGGTVVYDQVCTFVFAEIPAAGPYDLKLLFDSPPFGVDEWNGRIALPGMAGQAK